MAEKKDCETCKYFKYKPGSSVCTFCGDFDNWTPIYSPAPPVKDMEVCTSCENKFLTEKMKQDSGENYFCQTCYSELSPIMKAEYEQSVKQYLKAEQETYSKEQLISSCKVIGRHLYKIFGMEDDKTETNIDFFIINNILPSLPKAEPQGQETYAWVKAMKDGVLNIPDNVVNYHWKNNVTDAPLLATSVYYAIRKNNNSELEKISWLSKSPTVSEGQGEYVLRAIEWLNTHNIINWDNLTVKTNKKLADYIMAELSPTPPPGE